MFEFHKDIKTQHVNSLPDRAYYIPSTKKNPTASKKLSDSITLLNGEWDFSYFNSEYDFTFSPESFDKIDVPSCIQYSGYDHHQYTNIRYPFPFNPPYVPKENPCCLYKRNFTLAKEENKRYFIDFEGVDSCHYVYINDQFIGYGQVSHSTSEYEITDFVNDGNNTVQVVVFKWCDGSYIEDQDKLRMTGIFRDVYIITRPENFISDYCIKTTNIVNDYAEIQIDFKDTCAELLKEIIITNTLGEKVEAAITKSASITFKIENPKLWTAETPYLYNIQFSTTDEIIVDTFGIRTVKIIDGILCVNSTPIKLKGVNRHDSYSDSGYTADTKKLIMDLTIMKEHNINAIRTSHYPNCPEFMKLCDKYGFYIIDECDLESHGTISCRAEWKSELYSQITNNPLWEESIVNRANKLVERDKNRCAVIIWSLGNESGFGVCTKASIKRIREIDTTRPIHYESFNDHPFAQINENEEKFDGVDLYSTMYPSIENIKKYLARPDESRPLVLCEYTHAMGNGPGGLKEYWDIFYKEPRLCGGFVWEFRDHTVYMGKAENGKDMYYYGGDFGEFPHDSNFCMDGLLYPNNKPHTGFAELKNAICPVKIIYENDQFFIKNMFDFKNLIDEVYLKVTLKQGKNIIFTTDIKSINCEPHKMAELPINLPKYNGNNVSVMFEVRKLHNSDLLNSGYLLGFTQIVLQDEIEFTVPNASTYQKINYSDDTKFITIIGNNFNYRFNKLTGSLDKIEFNNKLITDKPIEYNIFRAPTDNDRYIRNKWEAEAYDRTSVYTYSTTVTETENGIVIECPLSITAIYMSNIAEINSKWHIYNNGEIIPELKVSVREDTTFLPRFGLRLFLNKEFNRCEFLGYGPQESYVDKHLGSYKDIFDFKVSDMFEDYIKPQENSSHYDCNYIKAYSPLNSIMVTSNNKFSFNISEYDEYELANKAHNFELKKANDIILCVDYKISGIGSNSCGPELPETYRFNEKEFNFITKFSFE